MRERILIDTSALIAYFLSQEEGHPEIRQYIEDHPDQEWIILSTVFSEVMTWLRSKTNPVKTDSIGSFLRNQCTYQVLSPDLDQKVWENFRRFPDKGWSYVDCSLLTISGYLNIPHVLTLDYHFRQMRNLGVIPCPDH